MKTKPKILYLDIETNPNEGYFFDIFSDRGIPLQFVIRPKSICTVAYKWGHEEEVHLLKVNTPYKDKPVLKPLLSVLEQADYIVGHFIDGFDIPFINGRLLANGLPPMPTIPTIDTYKLAKKHFGRTLNSNKLDNLGTILGVGNKNKTDVTLWVRCAQGDKAAIDEMGEYNVQDVLLLEKVTLKMLPYVNSKLNMNLFTEQAELVCTNCGSCNVQRRGTLVTKLTKKIRLQCMDCGSWSSTRYEEDDNTGKSKEVKKPVSLVHKNVKTKGKA